MFIVGIAGFKRCGKDTFAQFLMEELSEIDITSVRRGFADPLKEETAHFLHTYFYPEISYEEYLNRLHADGAIKEQYRLLIQWWGTEGRRMHNDPEYWILKMKEFADSRTEQVLIIPDTRFMNEIDFIHKEDCNNLVVLVNRPGIYAGDHPSEKQIEEYKDWSIAIRNDGSVEDLRKRAKFVTTIIQLHLIKGHEAANAICRHIKKMDEQLKDINEQLVRQIECDRRRGC